MFQKNVPKLHFTDNFLMRQITVYKKTLWKKVSSSKQDVNQVTIFSSCLTETFLEESQDLLFFSQQPRSYFRTSRLSERNLLLFRCNTKIFRCSTSRRNFNYPDTTREIKNQAISLHAMRLIILSK